MNDFFNTSKFTLVDEDNTSIDCIILKDEFLISELMIYKTSPLKN